MMTDNTNASIFERHGSRLLSKGYLVVPIKPNQKRPALDDWQHARMGSGDLKRFPNHGVGVLCGQGDLPISAIDIDTSNTRLANAFLEWCQENLGITVERIGNAPKILLPYLAAESGWRKTVSPWFKDKSGDRHRLEVLGAGQQFVAYAIHPDTHRPYEWTDLFGGLEEMPAVELPVITADQVEAAVTKFEQLAVAAGLQRLMGAVQSGPYSAAGGADDPLMTYEPPVGMDLARARELLKHVDNEDYDTWLKAGMALHHEFAGNSDALALWDEWSAAASNYSGDEDLVKRWEGFGASGRAPTTARWLIKVSNISSQQQEREAQRELLEWSRQAIACCEDSVDLIEQVAPDVGREAKGSPAALTELLGLLQSRFKELTGARLYMKDARQALEGNQKAVAVVRGQRYQMTEFGNSDRLLDHYGDELMYVASLDRWYRWDDIYWRPAHLADVEYLAKLTVRNMIDEAKDIIEEDARVNFMKFAAESQKSVMARNMVSLARGEPRVAVDVPDLDADKSLLGVANGVIDLGTGALLAPAQEYRITVITDTEYDPLAECPLFEQTLLDVFSGDEELIDFFQRLMGYMLMGQPNEDILVILFGSGSNGKSTVLDAVRNALGAHARTAEAETFLGTGKANAGGTREDVLRLRGSRFVHVTEPEEAGELREAFVKSMAGGESIPARGLYSRTTIEVFPTWVTFMPTNHLPIIKGTDHGIWRRIVPIPFLRNFDNDPNVNKDPRRAEKLVREAPGILAWAVQGALDYQREGLRLPQSVKKAREEYRNDMDLLGEWMAECCTIGQGQAASNAQLWASWESFARGRGELRYISSAKALGRRLEAKGFKSIKDEYGIRGRGRAGISVKQTGDFD